MPSYFKRSLGSAYDAFGPEPGVIYADSVLLGFLEIEPYLDDDLLEFRQSFDLK